MTGRIKKVKEHERVVILEDKTEILIEEIVDIQEQREQ